MSEKIGKSNIIIILILLIVIILFGIMYIFVPFLLFDLLPTLIISLVIVYGVAFIGSLFTRGNTSGEWYESIRPAITPPNWVFPVVWNISLFYTDIKFNARC